MIRKFHNHNRSFEPSLSNQSRLDVQSVSTTSLLNCDKYRSTMMGMTEFPHLIVVVDDEDYVSSVLSNTSEEK